MALTSSTGKSTLKIDLHTHILPERWPDLHRKYGYGSWVQLESIPGDTTTANMTVGGKFFRQVNCNCWSPEKRKEECNQTSVTIQVLSTVPVMFSYWAKPQDTADLARYLNDHIAQLVAEDPTRFVGTRYI
jgi:aminocarboxymuconate-semialdehyde decarboxylase